MKSKLIVKELKKQQIKKDKVSDNFKFSSSVAEFGLLLRNSKYKEKASYQNVIKRATESKGEDKWNYRKEFIELVEDASNLDIRSTSSQGISTK